jgi:hypothetical protein
VSPRRVGGGGGSLTLCDTGIAQGHVSLGAVVFSPLTFEMGFAGVVEELLPEELERDGVVGVSGVAIGAPRLEELLDKWLPWASGSGGWCSVPRGPCQVSWPLWGGRGAGSPSVRGPLNPSLLLFAWREGQG